MDKDESIFEDGVIDGENELLDIDLDDLTSEESRDSGDDDEIIELVDLVEEESEIGVADSDENYDEEIARLLEDEGAISSDAQPGGDSVESELDDLLGDVDLGSEDGDIDMSDVALDMSGGEDSDEDVEFIEESELEEQENLDSLLETDDDNALTVNLEELDSGLEEEVREEDLPEGILEIDEPSPSHEDEERELSELIADEMEDVVELETETDSEPEQEAVSPDATGAGEFEPGDDITEEALEKMLEGEVDEFLPDDSEEESPSRELEEPEQTSPPQPFAEPSISQERLEEVIKKTVEETVAGAVQKTIAEVAEGVIKETINETAERIIRETVTDVAERVIRDTIDALKASLVSTGE